jgi:hypothetical protein
MTTLSLFTLIAALGQSPGATEPPAADPLALGLQVGRPVPPFEASDPNGRLRSFASLVGQKGLVLVFFRSADW